MNYTYKVTTAFDMPDWPFIQNAIFSQAQTLSTQCGGNLGTFTFATPQTPADLGPLVKVELIPSEPQ